MNQDIQKLEEEKANLLKQIQELEDSKNKIFTRIVEIQGVVKFLQGKDNEPKKETK